MHPQKITFPRPKNIHINMMPIIMGDHNTIPFKEYIPIIEKCRFEKGATVYLTIKESFVEKDKNHRRGGVHTDAVRKGSWGGPWGGTKGIYMASNDGACEIYDCETDDVDSSGALTDENELNKVDKYKCKSNHLYWISDRTPHESLKANSDYYRQFFRLVGPDIYGWFSEHSTASPFGVKPLASVIMGNKFTSPKLY